MPGHMAWYICGIGQQVWSHAFGGLSSKPVVSCEMIAMYIVNCADSS